MPRPNRRQLVASLLTHYPRSYAEQLGVRSLDAPSGLFKLLVMALLMSARIRAPIALDATRALFGEGWTTPRRMTDATWAQRTRVLNQAGYARYDERTSRMLGDTAAFLLDEYAGDLRRLRDRADREPAAERRLLKQCKGVGDVGVDIFFREAQRGWDELHPFVDARAQRVADRLGLPTDPRRLAGLTSGPAEFTRLISALVAADLDGALDDLVDDGDG